MNTKLFFRMVIGLVLVFSAIVLPLRPAAALNLNSTRWYLRDQNIGIKLIGNDDNDGKSIFCPTAGDCKIVYYDYTNGDLKFYDCDDPGCFTGTSTTVDSVGDVGQDLSISCPAADDCKIAYADVTNGPLVDAALLFFDCDNATCSAGTRRVLDGDAGCTLSKGDAACSPSRNAGHYPAISCLTTDNCKIAYRANTPPNLYFADCDDATCSDGTINIVDLDPGCSLIGCDVHAGDTEHVNISCPASNDCKISVKDGSGDDLRFEDCDDETCNSGSSTLLDGNVGCKLTGGDGCSTNIDAGKHSVIFCLSSDDCKIVYVTNTYSSIRFADCDNAACTSGTVTYIDGETGCLLAGCSPTEDDYQPSISCLTGDDCKLTFSDITNHDLRFVDCDAASCDSGTISILDGKTGCTLLNCSVTATVGKYSSLYCPSAAECKVAYYDSTGGNLKFGSCEQGTCASGSTLTIDGNELSADTPGNVTTSSTFGKATGQVLRFVTELTYPTTDADDFISSGSYNLHLNYINNITSGTLVWNYQIGYCTIASDCNNKIVHGISTNQLIPAGGDAAIDIPINADTGLTIPAPGHSKWLYLELKVVTKATGTVTINMNNISGSGADSYLEYTPSANPTPTPSPTPLTTSITFQAAEDTYVMSSAPTTNYGGKKTVGTDHSPIVNGLLRFNVSGIPVGATVLSAKIRLYVTNGSDLSGTLSEVSGAWDEATTTWNSAPAIGNPLADLPNPAIIGSWVEGDVTGWVVTNGTYDVYLTSTSADNTTYNSSEAGTNLPELVVEYQP